MNKLLSASGLLGVGALLASCDASEPGPGNITVQYEFQGVESPSRVSVYLLPSSVAVDCETLSGDPFDLATDSARSLPLTGDTTFLDLPADSTWTIAAVGALDGSRVASGCVDGVKVVDGETTFAALTLENTPLDIQGAYLSTMEFNSGLPVEVIGAAFTYDAFYIDFVDFVCSLLDECLVLEEDEQQAIATELLTTMASLDLEVEWTFRQSADLIHGEMAWRTVEGVVVDPTKWKLVEGSFSGEIPGSTQILFTSSDLRINSDELTLFLLEEVMHRELTDQQDLTDSIFPDMLLYSGDGVAIDDDFTGQADRVNGQMHAELEFGSLGFTHNFDIVWTASRMQSN